ncbi:hypothetical protein LTR17_004639 [Elasticomyces elasticus]|nr:hypothetical protein LTR17_004639 [Elasticomyces elasticus]
MASKRDSKGRFIKTTAAFRRLGSFRFLDLPPELRNRCYRYALLWPDIIVLAGDARMEPGLLRASRQLREEGASIYYSENRFLFTIRDMAGAEMMPFRHLQLKFSKVARGVFRYTVAPGVNWANLLAWLKAHHAHRRRASEACTIVVPSLGRRAKSRASHHSGRIRHFTHDADRELEQD